MAWQALAWATALILTAPAMAIAESARFDIAAQPLPTALKVFAEQAKMQLLYQPGAVDRAVANPIAGDLDKHAALEQLLRGTGLEVIYSTENAATIRAIHTVPGADASSLTSPLDTLATDSAVSVADGSAGKTSFWDRFRLAQVDQGQTSSPSTVEKQEEQASKKKPMQLEEVVVTGSRLPHANVEGAQDVKVFTRLDIDQSGQNTIADFLSTIPSFSVTTGENGFQTINGSTTVQLRGLPYGTTLVLLNGRRVQTSGLLATNDSFDLNNIPLAAVERIEVLADGSSAIYGSDAVAGVVNIILKKDFDGFEADAKFGGAADIHEVETSVAAGHHWESGALSVIASYQDRSALNAQDRALTKSNDYTRYGGPNNNVAQCNPGNVFSIDGITPLPGLGGATYAAVPAGFTGTPSIQEFKGTAGTLNQCPLLGVNDIIPATHRFGILTLGTYEMSDSVELFSEGMYSDIRQYSRNFYNGLYVVPGFQSFTVAASNPYNPFGTAVGVGDLFTSLPPVSYFGNTTFLRGVIGARGRLLDNWRWEISAWESYDYTALHSPENNVDSTGLQNALNSSNPATALNPFIAGPPAAQSLLQSFFSDTYQTFGGENLTANGFIRGPLLHLPGGAIDVVVGGEVARDSLSSDDVNYPAVAPPNTSTHFHRDRYALFSEARLPIVANHTNPAAGETLALTVAGRLDHYSDFGTKATPQVGAEWRPLTGLLFRGTYASSFKAPSLNSLFMARQVAPVPFTDPLTGQIDVVTQITGGNPLLRPETGQSRTLGVMYLSPSIPDLQLSITQWTIDLKNTIESLNPSIIVANENLFPGDVIRAPGSNGQPGPITTLIATNVNFGEFNVAGLDYQLSYRYRTSVGVLTSAVSVSQTYHYTANLTPGTPATDRDSIANDDGNWASRWKGSIVLGWEIGPLFANITGRYVGRYQDYDSTREIGNFWLSDVHFRYSIGHVLAPGSAWFKNAELSVGAVNVFNRLPQFSNYSGAFVGYDATQADIRGRFVYLQASVKL